MARTQNAFSARRSPLGVKAITVLNAFFRPGLVINLMIYWWLFIQDRPEYLPANRCSHH
jgi:hypothetical protein